MSQDRFDKINAEATVEWRLVNAKIVKEHFEASVLPTPLNAIEHLLVRPRFFRPALPSTYLSVFAGCAGGGGGVAEEAAAEGGGRHGERNAAPERAVLGAALRLPGL